METNRVVNCQIPHNEKDQSAPAAVPAEHNQKRVEGILNSDVHVKGQGDILIRQLLSPLCSAAVVIRRHDGSYLDPCDFGSLPRHNHSKRIERCSEH